LCLGKTCESNKEGKVASQGGRQTLNASLIIMLHKIYRGHKTQQTISKMINSESQQSVTFCHWLICQQFVSSLFSSPHYTHHITPNFLASININEVQPNVMNDFEAPDFGKISSQPHMKLRKTDTN
jgi:hypothetical protein